MAPASIAEIIMPPDATPQPIWVVLVNYNGLADTRRCLESLLLQDWPAAVVVVDNASREPCIEPLRHEFPTVHLIPSPINSGWAGGNNLGINYAMERGAELILLLNNDTLAAPRLVRRLREAAIAFPQYGVLGSVIMHLDEPEVVQTTGVTFNRPAKTGFFQPIDVPYDADAPIGVVPVDIVNGCCLMVRRSLVDRIGLIDEQFFLVHEESDWCLRAGEAGAPCGVVTDAMVWHKGSSTFRREGKKFQRYYDSRNLVRLIVKHRGGRRGRGWIGSFLYYLRYSYHRYAHERESGFPDSAEGVLEGVYDATVGRYGAYRPAPRYGLGTIRALAQLVWWLKGERTEHGLPPLTPAP